MPHDELDMTLELGENGIEKLSVADVSMKELLDEYRQTKPPAPQSTGLYGLTCFRGGGAFANPEVNGKSYDFRIDNQE